ncbi:DUF4383 domain-containing protein [Oculatella sp. LEGE 06141]|uniref:DUF4383 domain-containing protein n=1 Tax=Oculatella sp. LEGE 06141 TaxID=1828648 RepID=UPI00187EFCBF|nr:DUF4383 domain-containing protein [Oculatella sp. LEGE 06141]MBE9179604.1 DUF4383 domain-containing protein [Oculatella sp. LEGE 06141]
MPIRYISLLLGVSFLLLGLAGFVPSLVLLPNAAADAPINTPSLLFNDGYGYLFGLFPTNYLHNAVHIAVGVLGIAAFTSLGGALLYLRGFAIAYFLIALMGLLPLSNTVFGSMPIYGNNVWLNALSAAIATYYGFLKPIEAADLSRTSGTY